MELALGEKPKPAVNGQTTECNSKLIPTESNVNNMSEIYLYNFEYLKTNYDKYIRDDFLYAFGAFYCDKVMVIPHLDRILKTECYHHETELKYRHYEFAIYMENIISWLDLKLKYFNGESSKSDEKIQEQLFKTSYIQQHSTKINLHCKALDENTDSHEQYIKSRSVANSQNEIKTFPDITAIKNEDLSGSSTNDPKTNIFMQNTQNELILSKIISPQHDTLVNSTNNYKKGIDKVNNILYKIIMSPDVTSPKHDTLENSTNNHKKGIDMVNNIQNTTITSPDINSSEHDILENSSDNHKKEIDMVNNIQNTTITSPNINSPEHGTLENSSDNHKKEIDIVNNIQNITITLSDINSPEHDTLENSSDNYKKEIDMVNNTLIKIATLSDATFLKHNVPESSTNDYNTEISMKNNKSQMIVSPRHNSTISTTNDHEKKIDKINSNLVNILPVVDSISTESQLKSLDITGYVKENISDNLKNNKNDKVVNEDKLYSAQTSSSSSISEESSNMCLEISTKSIRCTRANNKQTNGKLVKTSTRVLKRSNSGTDSENKSKKKKTEKPSPSYAEKKTNTNKNNTSVKVLNESIKQVSRNVYNRNSKGETKLHSACAKGKLDLVTSLLEDGFNPNVKDNAGWTPMHEAVKSGNLDIVKELIKFGAYLNVPGFEYESPLYTAIKYGKFEIAKIILNYGADANFINMYGDNARCLNKEKLSELLENLVLCKPTQICVANYKLDEIVIVLNNVSLKRATVDIFCKKFNIKLVKSILKENQSAQVTHLIIPKTENNTCDVNLECLFGLANGLFIINENWISDSLDQNKLMKCENYEVSGTTLFADCNGPKMSRISKQKLLPKLFDGMNIHICGSNGWNQFTLEHLKKLVVEFGAKLLIRMPNPEDCPTNIIPYHCRNNDQMFHVSNIILYTMDSNRLIKYNMKHLKAFHISWFIEVIQKYNIV